MDIQRFFDIINKSYHHLHEFIENSENPDLELSTLIKDLDELPICANKELMKLFLLIILKVSNSHHQDKDFFNKIFSIIQYILVKSNRILSNWEILHIFKSNKKILHFLLKNNIISFDEQISKYIYKKSFLSPKKYRSYRYIFFPEIKPYIHKEKVKIIEREIHKFDTNFFITLESNRQKGENNSSILYEYIRNDSVEEFISYVNKNQISLSSYIEPSLFESHSFLIQRQKVTLIEYAAFFGSIQIFQYLQINGVDLSPSLWLFAIHSNNGQIIHFLEGIQTEQISKSNDEFIEESIKCHHNDMAKYFLINSNENNQFNKKVFDYGFHFFNFEFLQFDDIINNINLSLSKACKYNYFIIVELLLNKKFDGISI